MRISDVIGGKPSKDVITISPDAKVRDLIRLLAEHNVGALVVSGDGSTVDGIVSERDVVRHLLDSDDILEGAVSAIMTAEVATAEPATTLEAMRALMTERRIRHVPVVADGRLVGIISIGDVVKAAMDQLTFERDQLDHYVQGG
ncbi:CBS domain-containing protein [Nocardioides agariphilus]|jgi:CBS domain-containing protein|uniref:CBS domain-containing protein n=1 Tax=Nocardioides agariphilus TaxID=433664 RepID=A0A930VRM2_9ACTN|nr:CBS domain-containing protein [Nocardioides agariphilus]MBF4769626.1 CBS domain-containing protein [Nocardioides agariphilus]